jgi:hypothetical protein
VAKLKRTGQAYTAAKPGRPSGRLDSRKRGFDRFDYLLTLDELQRIADARVHPSNRPQR